MSLVEVEAVLHYREVHGDDLAGFTQLNRMQQRSFMTAGVPRLTTAFPELDAHIPRVSEIQLCAATELTLNQYAPMIDTAQNPNPHESVFAETACLFISLGYINRVLIKEDDPHRVCAPEYTLLELHNAIVSAYFCQFHVHETMEMTIWKM
jgi:hypothetical protein